MCHDDDDCDTHTHTVRLTLPLFPVYPARNYPRAANSCDELLLAVVAVFQNQPLRNQIVVSVGRFIFRTRTIIIIYTA